MSGTAQGFSYDKKLKIEKETQVNATSGSGSGGSGEPCPPSGGPVGPNRGTDWFCWAPVIVFFILFILVIVGVACSGWNYSAHCGGWGGGAIAGLVLLFFIIWILVLGFFCWSGNSTAAWFFLILIIVIIFIYLLAAWISRFCDGRSGRSC